MTYATDTNKLDGVTIVTLLEIDLTTMVTSAPTSGTTFFRFSPYRNGTSDIVYNGNTYSYLGFEAAGFRAEINGGAPAPTITIDKATLLRTTAWTTMLDAWITRTGQYYFDPRGAKVKIIRTSTSAMDTTQQTVVQEYIVSQATREDDATIEWQLAVGLGVDRLNSQSIQALAVNRCSLRYRTWDAATSTFKYVDEDAGGCPYGNPTTVSDWTVVPFFGLKYFNAADAALSDPNKNLDKCSYSAKGCQLRFDPNNEGLVLPFHMLYSPNTLGT